MPASGRRSRLGRHALVVVLTMLGFALVIAALLPGEVRAACVAFAATYCSFGALWRFPAQAGMSLVHWTTLGLVADYLLARRLWERRAWPAWLVLARLALLGLALGLDVGYIAGISIASFALTAAWCLAVFWRRSREVRPFSRARIAGWAAALRGDLHAHPRTSIALIAGALWALAVYVPLVGQIGLAARSFDFSTFREHFWWASPARLLVPILPGGVPEWIGRLLHDSPEGELVAQPGLAILLAGAAGLIAARRRLGAVVPAPTLMAGLLPLRPRTLEWPFRIAAGTGVATGELCPFYLRQAGISALCQFHGKKAVGHYFGRLHSEQIAPFFAAGWQHVFLPNGPPLLLELRSGGRGAAPGHGTRREPAMMPTADRPWWRRTRLRYALGGVLAGGLLLLVRPVSPFEWDEVLYQRALDGYDVARHSPHPPGAPAFIWAAGLVRLVVGDPQLALQLVTIACALAALLLLVGLASDAKARGPAQFAGAALLICMPAFLFYGNVGLSDVPATAGLLAAVLACMRALDEPRRLPVAAGVVALALGVRPQLVPALLPAGLAAIVVAVRRRAWKSLAVAFGAGVAVSAAIWLPAVLTTGIDRFRAALADHSRYWIGVEKQVRLPGAPLGKVLQHWLIAPVGRPPVAIAFWTFAALGGVSWWRSGRRRLVAIAGGTTLVYLVSATFAMNLDASVRYVLPALALAALLAAGVLAVPWRWARVVAGLGLLAWSGAALSWGWPVLMLRREPAPVWAALHWVAQHHDPSRTTVAFDGVFRPHALYVLQRAGFSLERIAGERIYAEELRPEGDVVIVTPWPIPGSEVLFERVWPSAPLRQLTMGRYERCTVQRLTAARGPRFSPAFRAEDRGVVLWGVGRIELAAGSAPMRTEVCPLSFPVSLEPAGAAPVQVERGTCVSVTLSPGPDSALTLRAPARLHALLRPMLFQPVP